MSQIVRSVTGAAAATTITAPMTTGSPASGGGTFSVVSGAGYPTANFIVVIDRGTATEEKILISSRSGTVFTVGTSGRGYDGTATAAHSNGATLEHVLDALVVTALLEHVNTNAGDDHGTQYLRRSDAAGAGLGITAGVLAVNVDNATVEVNADTLRQKDAGTTNAKLANMAQSTVKMRAAGAGTGAPIDGTVAQLKTLLALATADLSDFTTASQDVVGGLTGFGGNGLTFTYAAHAVTLAVNVDGVTIEINADTVRLKDGAVTQAKVATGFRLISVGTADASSPATGDVEVRTDLGNKFYIWSGSAWVLIFNPGAWDTFTPVLGQGTALTKTINYAKFIATGRLRVFEAKLTSTQSGTAGQPIEVTLPDAAAFAGDLVVGAFNVILAAPSNNIGVAVMHTTTTLRGICHGSNDYVGTNPNLQVVSGTVISILASYETAS